MSEFPQKMTGLRDARVPGAIKPLFEMIVDGSAATGALTNPAVTRTVPTAQMLHTEAMQAARFYFGGTDANDETINYQIIGWVPCDPGDAGGAAVLMPILLAKGAITLGTLVMTTLVADGFIADTLTDTVDQYGTVLDGDASPQAGANTPASIILDVRNCLYVTVETDLGTAASAYVWGAPVTPPLNQSDAATT